MGGPNVKIIQVCCLQVPSCSCCWYYTALNADYVVTICEQNTAEWKETLANAGAKAVVVDFFAECGWRLLVRWSMAQLLE